MCRRLVVSVLVALPLAASAGFSQERAEAPYRDPRLPMRARVEDLLARMTLEEKFWQLFMIPGDIDDPGHDYSHGVFGLQVPRADEPASEGQAEGRGDPGRTVAAAALADAERINAIQRYFADQTRLGIPIIPFEEAVHGLMRPGATVFPQAIALAASWDSDLMARVAAAIARETHSRGIRQVLSPVVNIAGDVRWGRVEETYGEDPYLAAAMARAFVGAFEAAGVIATPKHFVANVGDGGRDSYPIALDERLLEEVYFPPFRAALAAGAGSLMSAYNSVGGLPATQNPWLLTQVLRRQWGFAGFVISDAAATGGATVLHLTEASTATAAQHALAAGLDVIFQSSWPQHRPYLEAFRSGLIPDAVIDAAVARVLRAKLELGLFEDPYVDPELAAEVNGSAEHGELAREAARASFVLLRNEGELLPLSRSLQTVAVLGTDAVEARLGGYSGPGVAKVAIFDGLREAFGPGTTVAHEPGPGRGLREHGVIPARYLTPAAGADEHGLRGEYFDNIRLAGAPRVARTDPTVDYHWTLSPPAGGLPRDWYSVRWTGIVTAPAGGVRRIGVDGDDGYRLWVDGALRIDNWIKRSHDTRLVEVDLAPGSEHEIRLEYFETTGDARLALVWDAGGDDDARRRIRRAAELARRSEVAVVVAGIEEGEFRDRAFLGLPGRQEELIAAVAETGTPVVVVLIGGSAITMSSWLPSVDAVIMAWYPGEQGGRALGDVLLGVHGPAGRLPITFPIAEGQLPLVYNHKPSGRGDDYVDLSGRPLFPFGFGLGYTAFEYSDLVVEPAAIAAGDAATVHFRVRNSGDRAADEVAQLYVRDLLASVARPVMELKGFARLHLRPGEERAVALPLNAADLEMLDAGMRRVVEPGAFRILVGASSRDIRLRGELTVR